MAVAGKVVVVISSMSVYDKRMRKVVEMNEEQVCVCLRERKIE